MLGHAAIAETALADVGGVVQTATADITAIGSTVFVGSGTLAGVANISAIFTQTTEVNTKSSGVLDVSFNFTQTTTDINLVKPGSVDFDSNFTKTIVAGATFSATTTQQMSFTKTSSGDILFVEINKGKRPAAIGAPTYTEVSPTGVETWTEITPSGTETYTEIGA